TVWTRLLLLGGGGGGFFCLWQIVIRIKRYKKQTGAVVQFMSYKFTSCIFNWGLKSMYIIALKY
ncbi:hypothetical protein LSH36_30g09022, partial [Paralvinella palmiformis]